MKKFYVYILVLTLFGALISCDDTNNSDSVSTEDTVQILVANWEADTLMEMVNQVYINNALKKGKMYMELKDKLTGNKLNVRLVGFEDTIYQTAKETGYVTAKMQTYHPDDKGDTLKVDYQIIWKLERGRYEIGDTYIRQMKDQVKYGWKKRDEFYERVSTQEIEAEETPAV